MPPTSETFARIRVIGVGGSGKNATNHMLKANIPGVEFIAANTDSQDLQQSKAVKKVHLGKKTTQGLGTGMDPALGRTAAEESITEIQEALKGSDLIFIACGMGGGTGTGAAPVIAKAALDLGILTVAVVTKPFSFEGGKRKSVAEEGITELMRSTDAIVIIPNDNILASVDDKTSMADAFALSDTVLQKAVSGISQLIIKPGDINIDFADIRVILKNSGVALLGLGHGRGSNRAEVAVTRAISSPLLDTSIKGAKRVLFSIASRSRSEISMHEVKTISERIAESVDPNAKIIFGTSTDKDLKQGEICVTLIATAFEKTQPMIVKNAMHTANSDEHMNVYPQSANKKAERLSDFTPEHTEFEDEDVLNNGEEYEDEEYSDDEEEEYLEDKNEYADDARDNTQSGWRRLWSKKR